MNYGGAVHLDDSEFDVHVAITELAVGADARIVDEQVDGYAAVFGELTFRFRPKCTYFWVICRSAEPFDSCLSLALLSFIF